MAEHATRERWTNWGRSAESHPVRTVHPTSTADVVATVREAVSAGLPVKAIGASHSFTTIGATDGVLLRLDRMTAIVAIDVTTRRVRVQAGISLHDLNPLLRGRGLALPNLGDVDPQSVAGAISTGTHGTGGRLFGISAAVVAVQLVTAAGDVLEIDEQHPWFGAARVTLGALGIVTEVTLQCVPAFLLHAREEPMALPAVMEQLPSLVDDNDHFEFYWFPHTTRTLTKRNNRVPEGTARRPLGRVRRWVDDELLSNTAFEGINRVVARRRSWIPRVNGVAASVLSAREFVDDSFEVFVSSRDVRFREAEFAMPREALPHVLGELAAWFGAGHENISFPIEVRFTAADDVWMSTGHERDNCYVAVHQYWRSDYRAYFAAAQDIFTAHEGRPHWGKLHTLDAGYFARRYARFDDFVAVRDELDPGRTFSNAYLDRVLG
ncbi:MULTISPECIES: D-arabinono-1,4-lactone oxidase [Aeromicrobium]|uniref:D-arabinono-1,4-lactone oxidase n=1 Tax=Aeromicrobium TaxID=2040 RepID=UPI0006F2AB19|nr:MULTISPECIES: D-arabinono-1,4-lactone oxidase [Aeromicrobium]KQX71741.1 FAD-linked oxidoreductase [Aeromicrobium sp. Root472D3]MCL8251803.1 FAD-binding protein [Aeromicrobium fastidiosum]